MRGWIGMIKVLLVEEQRLLRSSMQVLIDHEEDMEVVGVYDDGKEALHQVKRLEPDVVLIDIDLEQSKGIEAVQMMKEENPTLKVVFLMEKPERQLIIQAVAIGADGLLLKKLQPEQLYRSIREAYHGQVILSGRVASTLVDYVREIVIDKKRILIQKLDEEGVELSNRQLDVTYLLMEGYTNKQIAKRLYLSEGTIKNYVSVIYDQLGIHYRDLVIRYLRKLVEEGKKRA